MIIAQEPLFYPIGQDPILRYAPKAKESPATILTSLVPPEPLQWSRWPPVQAHVTRSTRWTHVRRVRRASSRGIRSQTWGRSFAHSLHQSIARVSRKMSSGLPKNLTSCLPPRFLVDLSKSAVLCPAFFIQGIQV